jgi:hypothetical protein
MGPELIDAGQLVAIRVRGVVDEFVVAHDRTAWVSRRLARRLAALRLRGRASFEGLLFFPSAIPTFGANRPARDRRIERFPGPSEIKISPRFGPR